jgi:hypothetical protein
MDDENSNFDLAGALQWCLQVQRERILRGLYCEISTLKLSPDLRRELLAFAKIAQLAASNSQGRNSQSGGAGSSEKPPSPTAVREEITKLDSEDRHLLREAVEELVSNLDQLNASKEVGETNNLGEQINDKKNSSGE